jgi:hypothetical protein
MKHKHVTENGNSIKKDSMKQDEVLRSQVMREQLGEI